METENKCNSMFRTMGEDRAWWDKQCGNLIPSPWHEWVRMRGSIWIHLQCLHTLARSPCTGVCMPIGDQFLNSLSEKFRIQVPRQLWLEQGLCYGTLNTNNFYFLFFYFFWFYFSFSFSLFYFSGKTMKKARDKEVTWQVTWCDVIGLEPGGRI